MNLIFEKDYDLTIFEPYQINCENCCGLCCVTPYIRKTNGFPKDKEAGNVCGNLQTDYKCKVHPQLSQQGLKGCMAYDCFGAGQYVTRHIKTLPNWHNISIKEADDIFKSFLVVTGVHQTLWYLSQCLIVQLSQTDKEQARSLLAEGHALIEKSLEMLAVLNTQPFCKKSNEYLKHISMIYQNSDKMQAKDYMGRNMKQANLEQANLYGANFLGADISDTNICNTDLSECLFLTQIQINSAKGNRNTVLPPYLYKPKLWNYN